VKATPLSTEIIRQTITATATPTIAVTSKPKSYRVWVSPDLPVSFLDQLQYSAPFVRTEVNDADIYLDINTGDTRIGNWIYCLVAPFPTIKDEISKSDLDQIWNGSQPQLLAMTRETYSVVSGLLGENIGTSVTFVDGNQLQDKIWANKAWAIVPFESLQPQWKVIKIDGISPLAKNFQQINMHFQCH